jgi:sialate O-acetylesterase
MKIQRIMLVAMALLARGAYADVTPNPVFSDNAVLQQGVAMPVWGKASPGERVTVEFQGQKAAAIAKDGSWIVTLRPLKQGEHLTMTVSGRNTVRIENIAVGEVWLASGQSNMAFRLVSAEGSAEEIATSADPLLRQGTIAREPSNVPLRETPVKWQEAKPQTAGDFSAVGYYFAKRLRKTLGCPVGILNGARGGTRIEAWMSDEALKPFEGQYDPRKPKNRSEGANVNTASALWNGIIAPVVPFPIRGVIWYQGESNAGEADLYRKTFPAMIQSWRRAWGHGDFPFLFVQLAPFMKIVSDPQESAWAEIRDAQRYTAQIVPNTAMAVITDCGDPDDIHPKRKAPVGERLALAAEALAYGKNVAYRGPTYRSMTVVGGRAVIEFADATAGLTANGGELTGFTIAGADRVFHNARATIHGPRVIVSSDAVANPVAVRFAWADCPVANLFNGAGLPASPFRTDNWPTPTLK